MPPGPQTARRGEFSSRLGFIFAATGSAVGLGNVWGFPTNAASNGGAAFLVVYLILAFCLAYPALMAELIIGRHSRSNIVSALGSLPASPRARRFGAAAGTIAVLTSGAILGFYTLVAGWMLSHLGAEAARLISWQTGASWLSQGGIARDLGCALVFSLLTAAVVSGGIKAGIERWSERMMPALMVLLAVLIGYVLLQPGAGAGLKLYLVPDLSRALHPQLILNALGQTFFSLSLGVGTMLIYGSYLPRTVNLPTTGALVTLVDVAIAFLAGLLILPAMFVAQHQGIEIYREGQLIAGPDLIFQVLPALFSAMGSAGALFALAFFALMTMAALTSSISMLEVPTAWLAESTPLSRRAAAWLAGTAILALTAAIVLWFDPLFGWVVKVTTEVSEPLMGIVLCLFAGWAIHRDTLLAELRRGDIAADNTWFWKIWPPYVRFVCPLLIAAVFVNSLR